MTRLSILLYTRASGGGGAERVWAILAEGLAARGHDVTFAYDAAAPGVVLDPRVKAVEIGAGHAAGTRALARLIRAGRFDVMASAVAVSAVKLALAKVMALSRTPLVVSFHGFEEYRTGKLSAAAYYGLPLLSQVTSRFVGVSEGLAEALVRRWHAPAAHTLAIHNPVPLLTAGSADEIAARGPVIGAVGRLSPEKGMDVLIHAFARLKTPEARLIIGGDGPERAALQAQAARLGMADRVSFLGRVASAGEVYGQAKVAAVPSRTEAFGMTTVEALSAGLRVVASDCEGSREILEQLQQKWEPVLRPELRENNGLEHVGEPEFAGHALAGGFGDLVPVGDTEALAAALDRALALPPDPAPGVMRAADFSVEVGLDRWEALFIELARRRG